MVTLYNTVLIVRYPYPVLKRVKVQLDEGSALPAMTDWVLLTMYLPGYKKVLVVLQLRFKMS